AGGVPAVELDGRLRVRAGARHPGAEVLEHVWPDPRIMLLPGLDAAGRAVGREALGQRRGDRLDQAHALDELHVPVAGEADAGEDLAETSHQAKVEADSLGEPQPERQAALTRALAVVVVDALDP